MLDDAQTKEATSFDDGALYDLFFDRLDLGLDFYLDLAQAGGGPVLDVACGTGRIMVPFLKSITQLPLTRAVLLRGASTARRTVLALLGKGCQQCQRLVLVLPVDEEVPVEREEPRAGGGLRQGHQAGIGKGHRHAGVAFHQLHHARRKAGEIQRVHKMSGLHMAAKRSRAKVALAQA